MRNHIIICTNPDDEHGFLVTSHGALRFTYDEALWVADEMRRCHPAPITYTIGLISEVAG